MHDEEEETPHSGECDAGQEASGDTEDASPPPGSRREPEMREFLGSEILTRREPGTRERRHDDGEDG